jgi:methyl-accepting chemotaxis protein
MATTAAGIETLRATAITLEQQVERFQLQETRPHDARRRATPLQDHPWRNRNPYPTLA